MCGGDPDWGLEPLLQSLEGVVEVVFLSKMLNLLNFILLKKKMLPDKLLVWVFLGVFFSFLFKLNFATKINLF